MCVYGIISDRGGARRGEWSNANEGARRAKRGEAEWSNEWSPS